MGKQFYTVKEASKILGRSLDRLYEDLRQGNIRVAVQKNGTSG